MPLLLAITTSLAVLIDDLSGLAVHSDGLPNTARLSYALSIVQSVKPRDPLESLLAGQMAAIHIATMRMANILAASKSLPNVEVVERS